MRRDAERCLSELGAPTANSKSENKNNSLKPLKHTSDENIRSEYDGKQLNGCVGDGDGDAYAVATSVAIE